MPEQGGLCASAEDGQNAALDRVQKPVWLAGIGARLPQIRDCGSHSMSARSAACRPSACRKAASTGALKGAPSAQRRELGATREMLVASVEQESDDRVLPSYRA
jgi:hypothetical protein